MITGVMISFTSRGESTKVGCVGCAMSVVPGCARDPCSLTSRFPDLQISLSSFRDVFGNQISSLCRHLRHGNSRRRSDVGKGLPPPDAIEALRVGGRGIGDDEDAAVADGQRQSGPVAADKRTPVFRTINSSAL